MFHSFFESKKQVYNLGELNESSLPLVGEKGAVLARLARLGCPVPDGFVISAPPRQIQHNRLGLSNSLKREIDDHIRELENKSGRRFFAADSDGGLGGGVRGAFLLPLLTLLPLLPLLPL